jgi:pimeloyl-ACP methyl ester carboxylesterase
VYQKVDSQTIYFTDHGEGDVVILLHGFMESSFMWKSLSERLSTGFRVINIDLPGHGKSDNFKEDFSIDHMAQVVFDLLGTLNISMVNIVGHSMGGYVILAFMKRFSSSVNSYILLHSKAEGDSEEVKKRRKLSIVMLKSHPQFVIKESITNLFRLETRSNFSKEIKVMISDGLDATQKAYEEAQLAMMKRQNRFDMLKCSTPKLYIAGKFDPIIPFEQSNKEIQVMRNGEHIILNHSGHMGFIEEKELCEKSIDVFLTKHQ